MEGITLITKTYGIRRIVPNDTWIESVSIFLLFSPFLLLLIVMFIENKQGLYIKKDKSKLTIENPKPSNPGDVLSITNKKV